jgi:geranylgeranyl pyrophosphate synthase
MASEFGVNLGIAFQMVDDVIDFEPTSEKDYAKDFSEGLVNFVVARLIKNKPELLPSLSENFGTNKMVWPEADLEFAKQEVRAMAADYLQKASVSLEGLAKYKAQGENADHCLDALNGILLVLGVRQS